MSVQVDEARRDDQSVRVDRSFGARAIQTANRDDPIAPDPDIAREPGIAGSVNDVAAANQEVVIGLLSAQPGRASGSRHDSDDDEHESTHSLHWMSNCFSCMARQMRSGVSGSSRTVTPVASRTADPMAAAIARMPPSPAPFAP